jgi:hypothetical protein
VTTKRRKPTTTPKLGAAGTALVAAIKRELGDTYELDEREALLLDLAAHQADDVARLEADVRDRGTIVLGSTGQPVLNPAIAEGRQARLALTKIIGGIALPDSASDSVKRARHAAEVRWRRQAS